MFAAAERLSSRSDIPASTWELSREFPNKCALVVLWACDRMPHPAEADTSGLEQLSVNSFHPRTSGVRLYADALGRGLR